MSKIGITSGTAIALSIAATVFYYQPSHASDALLVKAQSEFTAKARDAVLQRRTAQVPMGTALAAAPQSEPAQTYTLASLEPSQASVEASDSRSIPARTAPAPVATTPVSPATPVQAATVEAPVEIIKLPNVEAAPGSETKADEVQPVSKPLPVEAAVQTTAAPQQVELPKAAAPQVVTPVTNAAAPATVKVQKATSEPAKVVPALPARKATKVARRLERELSSERLPYNVEALRARAPEIAAAISRYM